MGRIATRLESLKAQDKVKIHKSNLPKMGFGNCGFSKMRLAQVPGFQVTGDAQMLKKGDDKTWHQKAKTLGRPTNRGEREKVARPRPGHAKS